MQSCNLEFTDTVFSSFILSLALPRFGSRSFCSTAFSPSVGRLLAFKHQDLHVVFLRLLDKR